MRTYRDLPVQNALAPATIDVSPAHIRKAEAFIKRYNRRKSSDQKGFKTLLPTNCALAYAGKEHFKTDVHVYPSRVFVLRSGYWERFIASARMRIEEAVNDRGGKVAAGSYTILNPLQPSHRPNGKRLGGNGKVKVKKKAKRTKFPPLRIANVRIYATQGSKVELN